MAATRTVFIDTALSDYQSLATQYDAGTFNVVLLNNASPHAAQIQGWMTSAGVSAADINIVSASASVNGAFTPRVVFVDSGVADVNTVIAGVPANATVVVLDAAKDGIQQIKDYLAANAGKVGAIDIVTDLASVDVVSHGAPGEVTLGSTVLNASNLASYSAQLADIGSHLSAGGDILLYGCDVASGTTGQQFISALASATGADVAASTDLTGSAAAGGDWTLEASTGTIETAALNIPGYDALLAVNLVVNSSSLTMQNDSDPTPGILTNVQTQTIRVDFTTTGNGTTPNIYVSTDGTGTSKTQVLADSIHYDSAHNTGYFTVSVTLQQGANKSIQVYTANGNGNPSLLSNATFQYTLDTTPPNAPSITGFNGSSVSGTILTNDTTPTLTITAEADSTVKVYSGTTLLGTAIQTTTKGTYTFTSSDLGSGNFNFTATATDAAGNTSAASAAQAITIDAIAPNAPSITGFNGGSVSGSILTNDTTPTLTITAEADSTVKVYSGTTLLGTATQTATKGTYTFTSSDLGSGNFSFTATATDAAGNTSAASAAQAMTIDAIAPNAPSITGFNGGSVSGTILTNDTTPTLTITAEADSTVQVFQGTTLLGTATQTATKGTYTFTSSDLVSGNYSFTVKATDAAGNTSAASAAQAITIDAIAPDAPHITGFNGGSVSGSVLTNDTTPTLTITAEADSTVKVYSGTALLGTATQTATGSGTYTFTSDALADGKYDFTVKATDAAGNTSTASSVQSITVDTAPPATSISLSNDTGSSGSDKLTRDAALVFGDLENGATRVIKVNGTAVDHYDAAGLKDGQYTVEVDDTDAAGNTGKATVTFTLDTKLTAPTASLAVDSGTAGDGVTNNAGLTFNNADSDATRVITVDGATVTGYDPSKLADGKHTVVVTDTDAAGNTASVTTAFTLDTQLTAPTAKLASDSGTDGDGLTNKADLLFNNADSDAKRVITVDGKEVTSYDPKSLADGHHTVVVTDTDTAGNKASATTEFTLDTTLTAPTAKLAVDSGTDGDGLTNKADLVFNNADSDAKRVITVDGKEVAAYDPKSLADGKHTVVVTDTDGAGNTASATTEFTLDTKLTAPTAKLATDSGTDGDGLTNKADLTFNNADSDAKRVITVDGKEVTSYDPKSLADGKHTVVVTDTDAAGNSASATTEFTLDTTLTAPTAALAVDSGTDGDGLTNKADLVFNNADSDAKRVITVDGKEVTGYDPKSLADGHHTVVVTDTDGAGNTASATTEFTLDTKLTAPTATLAVDSGTAGDGLTNKADLTFNNADSDAKRVITVDGSQVTGYDPKSLADGHHTVVVTDTDAAGNTASVTTEFTLDTKLTAPTAKLAVDSGTDGDGLTNKADLTFNNADSDAKRVITVDGKEVTGYDPKSLADGHHTIVVTDTDGAGNTASATTEFTLDTTLTAPTAALTVDSGTAGDGLTNNANLTLNNADADATRVIKVDGTVVDKYDASKLADGHHTVVVTDTDAAGNTASATTEFTLDTKLTAPTAALAVDSGTAGDGITNNAGLTFNTADSDAKRVITVDGKEVTSYDPKSLADGHHTVVVTDTDAAGNTASATSEFTLDTRLTAPTAKLALDSGTDGDGLTNKADLVFNTADGDAKRVITVDGKEVTSYDPKSLADGHHTVVVTDTDVAGNTASATTEFTLDTKLTAPTASLAVDSGAQGDGLTNNASLNFNTADGDATRVIKVDGTVVGSYDPSKLADGKHSVVVTDTDAAGNTASATTEFTLDTKLTAPTASLAVDSGAQGDGLTNNASLNFNTADSDATRVITVDGANVTAYDPTKLADGKHTIVVTDTDGAGNTASATTQFTLDTKLTAPTAALTLDSGTAGDGLTNNAGLTFNTADTDATRVIKVDGTVVDKYDASKLADGHHTVVVTDTDAAGNTASATANFELDSKGPVFSSAATASVAENIGANQVVYKAIASDAHGVTYSLGGTDAAKFDIGADGSVTLKDNPNYEAVNAYGFTVVATDSAGNHTDQAVALGITNVNEAPVATTVSASTIENAPISVHLADSVSDPDVGDTMSYSLGSSTASLSWANTDPTATSTLINPVTKAAVDISTLSVKASLAADGTVTLTPPSELDWMMTGQALKATFSYTATDAGGLKSQESINLVINGSTNDKGVTLSGGNGDDTLSGNASNNAEDVLMGNNGNDTLYGYGGTDALYGGNGDDKLFGGAGIDYLYGDNGNDTLDGGSEGDFLFGGKGDDVLTGGTGADKFVFAPQGGNDRITDFHASEGDMLYFADFFTTKMDEATFLSKYVTDIGNDLKISLQGTTIILTGVANVADLTGHIMFGTPV